MISDAAPNFQNKRSLYKRLLFLIILITIKKCDGTAGSSIEKEPGSNSGGCLSPYLNIMHLLKMHLLSHEIHPSIYKMGVQIENFDLLNFHRVL